MVISIIMIIQQFKTLYRSAKKVPLHIFLYHHHLLFNLKNHKEIFSEHRILLVIKTVFK